MAAASTRFGASSLRRMWETCTLAVLTLMTSAAAISRLVRPRATSVEHLGLARRQPEELLQALRRVGGAGVRRRRIEPRSLGEQLELAQQGLRSEPGRDGVGVPERHARLGAWRAGGDERLGLAPAAVRGERRALEALPGRGGVRPHSRGRASPRARSCSASASASQPPAFGRDRRGLRGGAASGGEQLLRAVEVVAAASRRGGRARARPARPARAAPSRTARRGAGRLRGELARARPSRTAASASVQRRSHRASSAR